MKFGFFIAFLLIGKLSFSQSIIHELTKDKRIGRDQEMILEITELFKTVKDSVKVDFNHSDTLFIIRGLDITTKVGYGYIWNNDLKTSYSHNKIWRRHTLISSNPRLEIKTTGVTWYEFDDLLPLIENWDTVGIKKYVDNCGEILGGIYWWTIIRCVKKDSKYNFESIAVREFGLCGKRETKEKSK